MRAFAVAAILVLGALALPGVASAQESGTWLVDTTTKCKLWWPSEDPFYTYTYSSLHWTGACRNGTASGHGTFEFAATIGRSGRPPTAYSQSGEGDFVDGKFTGRGFTSASKPGYRARAEGEFRDGRLNGRGLEVGESGGTIYRYEGSYLDGKLNGWAKHDVDEFDEATHKKTVFTHDEGDYVNGELDGRGILVRGAPGCSAQMRYEGEWKKGRMQGRGTLRTLDGKTYSGVFVNDCLGKLCAIDLIPSEADLRKVCR